MEPSEDIPQETRVKFWLVAWAVAGVVSLIPDPISALFFWAFPIGIFQVIFPQDREFGMPYLCGGWLFYGCLTAIALLQKGTGRFFIAYGILCLVLVFNVVGCHAIMNQPIQDSL